MKLTGNILQFIKIFLMVKLLGSKPLRYVYNIPLCDGNDFLNCLKFEIEPENI